MTVGALVVDEAHTVPDWGEEFRSAFKKLSHLRTLFGGVQIIALTATATASREQDIIKSLNMKHVQVNIIIHIANNTSFYDVFISYPFTTSRCVAYTFVCSFNITLTFLL